MENKRVVLCISAMMAAVLGLSGCADRDSNRAIGTGSDASGPLVVFVTNYPLKYFAERIGGEYASVSFPAPTDEDPAYWTPSPEIIGVYQNADLILLNGAGYENWTEAASLPRSKRCDTSRRFTSDDLILLEDATTHSHGPDGQHAHGGTAFTVWLDPMLAVKQADAICDAFAELRPQHAEEFRRNRDALARDLDTLDQEIASVLAKVADRPVLFSHPVYLWFSAVLVEMWSDLATSLADRPSANNCKTSRCRGEYPTVAPLEERRGKGVRSLYGRSPSAALFHF